MVFPYENGAASSALNEDEVLKAFSATMHWKAAGAVSAPASLIDYLYQSQTTTNLRISARRLRIQR
jgi:hypothetical protein